MEYFSKFPNPGKILQIFFFLTTVHWHENLQGTVKVLAISQLKKIHNFLMT